MDNINSGIEALLRATDVSLESSTYIDPANGNVLSNSVKPSPTSTSAEQISTAQLVEVIFGE